MSYQLITDGLVISQGPNVSAGLPTVFQLEVGDGDALLLILTSPTVNTLWIKVSGVWKLATTYIKVSGVWKQATPFIKVSGNWE